MDASSKSVIFNKAAAVFANLSELEKSFVAAQQQMEQHKQMMLAIEKSAGTLYACGLRRSAIISSTHDEPGGIQSGSCRFSFANKSCSSHDQGAGRGLEQGGQEGAESP